MKNYAFTLAEVLITLGIIGVVAAMTLPTLVQNYKKHEVETKLAKVYSVMNQAIKLSEVEYGDVSGWQLLECGASNETSCSIEDSQEWFNKYIGKNLKYLKIEKGDPDIANDGFVVYFADGSILNVTRYIRDMGYYVNKKALENPIPGVSSFSFRFSPQDSSDYNKYHTGKGFEPYAYSWDGTADGLLHNSASYGCGESGNAFCAKLIQLNGWKIPDDYPRKL